MGTENHMAMAEKHLLVSKLESAATEKALSVARAQVEATLAVAHELAKLNAPQKLMLGFDGSGGATEAIDGRFDRLWAQEDQFLHTGRVPDCTHGAPCDCPADVGHDYGWNR